MYGVGSVATFLFFSFMILNGYNVSDPMEGKTFYSPFFPWFYPSGLNLPVFAFKDNFIRIKRKRMGFPINYTKLYKKRKNFVYICRTNSSYKKVYIILPFDSFHFYRNIFGLNLIPYPIPYGFSNTAYNLYRHIPSRKGKDMHIQF